MSNTPFDPRIYINYRDDVDIPYCGIYTQEELEQERKTNPFFRWCDEVDPWLCLCAVCQDRVKTLSKQDLIVGSSNYEEMTRNDFCYAMHAIHSGVEETSTHKIKFICYINMYRLISSNQWVMELVSFRSKVFNKLIEFEKNDSCMSEIVRLVASIFKEHFFPREVHVERFRETLNLISELEPKDYFYREKLCNHFHSIVKEELMHVTWHPGRIQWVMDHETLSFWKES